ncbi:ankyrin [Setomelanomma holmii]|uniref:Ankyrin n=1 Tax=Setomelanomma holmii TaxID=210430 RepID=A0A9P4LS23_9PLEO|nr:ankyrin [Setomelanomma holmii]
MTAFSPSLYCPLPTGIAPIRSHFTTASMQSPVLEVMMFDGHPEDRPYETYIGDNGGELDISLHRAATRGDVVEISRLLEAGHNINGRDAGEESALNCAVIADKPEAVQTLLLHGADPGLRGNGGSDGQEGDDAALCAARLDRIEVMKVLIANGVGIHSYALGTAVESRIMEMLRLLVETTSSDFVDMPKPQAIEDLGYDATSVATDKQSGLNAALLAIFNQDDVHDDLMEMEPWRDWNVAVQIIKLLVDAGASVNAHEHSVPRTPLHFALQLQEPPPEFVNYLLAHGADVNAPNWLGRTPFFQLLTRADATEEMVNRFRDLGGKLDVTYDDGNTPLHLVRSPRIAGWLLASGVLQLLNAGAVVDEREEFSRTALMLASHVDVTTKLLERGANMHAVDEAGESASQLPGVSGFHINEAGNVESDTVPQTTQMQDNGIGEDAGSMKPASLTPRDPSWGNNQYKEYISLIQAWAKNPSCPQDTLYVDGYDYFYDAPVKRYLGRRDTCTETDFVKLVNWIVTLLRYPYSTPDTLKYDWDNIIVAFDRTQETLSYDNLQAFVAANDDWDSHGLVSDVFLDSYMAQQNIWNYQDVQRDCSSTSSCGTTTKRDNDEFLEVDINEVLDGPRMLDAVDVLEGSDVLDARDMLDEYRTYVSKAGTGPGRNNNSRTWRNQPDAGTILDGIENGNLPLQYARWQRMRQNAETFLELAYHIGPHRTALNNWARRL